MKAIVFTLDAIFALVIAAASVSILLYFQYSYQSPSVLPYTQAAGTMKALLGTGIGAISSDPLAKAMLVQASGANETWPQYQHDAQSSGSVPAGPAWPFVSYTINTNASINGAVIAGSGRIFFAAGNAQTPDFIYAANATAGRRLWAVNTVTEVATTPAIYGGAVIFANQTNITAVSEGSGTFLWSTNALLTYGAATSPALVYQGQAIFGTASSNVVAVSALDGNVLWAQSFSPYGAIVDLATVSGDIVSRTDSGVMCVTAVADSVPITLGTCNIASTNVTTYNNTIFYGSQSGHDEDALSVDTASPVFSIPTTYTVNAVAQGDGQIIFQQSGAVSSVSPAGAVAWTSNVPSFLGAPVNGEAPVTSSHSVYSFWSNDYLLAQNISTGATEWYTQIPLLTGSPKTSEAYGDLYLASGSEVLAYGVCPVQGTSSLLASALQLYVGGRGSCADYLLNRASPMTNYAVFINNTMGTDMSVANFNGVSTITVPTNASIDTNSYSWSIWIRPTSYGGCIITGSCSGFLLVVGRPTLAEAGSSASPQLSFFVSGTGLPALTSPLTYNSWQNVVVTFNFTTGNETMYVNGTEVASGVGTPVPRAQLPLEIGAGFTPSTLFEGQMSNLQVYNSTLTPREVAQLYADGMQSAPVGANDLAAWYPLAGDANDYASFTNTGYATGLSFVSTNYTPASLADAFELSKSSAVLPAFNLTTGASKLYDVGVYSWR